MSEPMRPTDAASVSLPTIDAGEFLHRCMDRMDFAEKILDCFRRQSVIYLQQIQDAVAQGHAQEAHRPAHTLKGASANLAAKKLADLAFQAEQAAAGEQLETVAQLIEPLKRELERVLKQAPQALADCPPSLPPSSSLPSPPAMPSSVANLPETLE